MSTRETRIEHLKLKVPTFYFFNLAVGMTSLQRIKPRAFSLSLFLTKGKDIILSKGFLRGGLVSVFWQNFISRSALSLLGWPSSRDCHRRNGSYAGLLMIRKVVGKKRH